MTTLVLLALALMPVLIPYLVRFFKYVVERRRINVIIDNIPGPKRIFPGAGNTPEFLLPPAELFNHIHKRNREYYPVWKATTPLFVAINVLHPDDMEIVLSSQKHITKGKLYRFLHPWFGTGLLTSTGQKWHTRRRILTPAFHFNVLREFSEVFDQEGRRMVDNLNEKGGEAVVDLLPFITKYTLNTICETAMGTSLAAVDSTSEKFQRTYREAILEVIEAMNQRVFRPWMQIDFIYYLSKTGRTQTRCLDIIRGFSKKVIGERHQYHQKTNDVHLDELHEDTTTYKVKFQSTSRKRLAMLDLLIASKKKTGNIDDDGIHEEVDTFMFEGHDTTALGICYTLMLLAEHKEHQELARAEVDAMMRDCDGKLGISELQQLPYLERCIKEALRLYPSVPFMARHMTEDLCIRNYIIPKGAQAHMHIYDLHRDPNFWPDPLRYDPDRFLPENVVGRHPFQYLPFSGGPRNCIGQKFAMMELKALVGHLLHNFRLEAVDTAAELQMLPDLVLRPQGTTRVKFIPR